MGTIKSLTFNPYALVDFATTEIHKGNFHCHSQGAKRILQPITIDPEGEDPIDLQPGWTVYMNNLIVDENNNVLYEAEPGWVARDQEARWLATPSNAPEVYRYGSGDAGMLAPDRIDGYHERGIKIVCLAEHDNEINYMNPAWPWNIFGRDPDSLGMMAIQGTEQGGQRDGEGQEHHRTVIFDDVFGNTPLDDGTTLEEMEELVTNQRMLMTWAHPGRHIEDMDTMTYGDVYPLSRYVNSFKNHNLISGLEIFNGDNRYPNDVFIWDDCLKELMPGRPLWGIGGDDAHGGIGGEDFNIIFMKRFDIGSLFRALSRGEFMAVHGSNDVSVHQNWLHPLLNNVIVDEDEGTISLNASNTDTVEWWYDRNVIATGNTFNYRLNEDVGNYVRVELHGQNGRACLQPFGFVDSPADVNIETKEAISKSSEYFPPSFP